MSLSVVMYNRVYMHLLVFFLWHVGVYCYMEEECLDRLDMRPVEPRQDGNAIMSGDMWA